MFYIIINNGITAAHGTYAVLLQHCYSTLKHIYSTNCNTFTALLQHIYCTLTSIILHYGITFTTPLQHIYSTFTALLQNIYSTSGTQCCTITALLLNTIIEIILDDLNSELLKWRFNKQAEKLVCVMLCVM